MSNTSNKDELPSLSDNDVQLLHRIVSLAEESSDPPFRALFAAYDKTLAEYGIQADHDRVYFRFLLRMGQLRSPGSSLFERFQSLLLELGIEVAFGDDDPYEQNNSSDEKVDDEEENEGKENEGKENEGESQGYLRSHVRQQNPTPSRRSSFDDVQEHEERLRTRRKPQKHARSRSFDNVTEHRPTEEVLSPPKPSVTKRAPASRTTLHNRNLDAAQRRFDRQRPAQVKHSQLLVQHDIAYESDDSGGSTISDDEEQDSKPDSVLPLRNREARTFHQMQDIHQMDMNAKNLRYHHSAARAILIFRSWITIATVTKEKHADMLSAAVSRDQETLSRQALEQWRLKLQEKRKDHDREVLYERLAQRAQRARDMFLLSKAFTHWADLTSEEVARAAAAKRFMLKSRYFNAWQEITVVNELKVRRQGMLRFWQIWRRRIREVRDSTASALSFRDLSSAEKCYRHWFWTFCERRAPLWYDAKIKTASLSNWVLRARQNMVHERLAVDLHTFQLLRRYTIQWVNLLATTQHNAQEAQAFRQRMLMLPVVAWLRKELELLPLESQTSYAVRFRTLKTAINIWRSRTKDYLKAALVNKRRILRNAWTCWNDRLRCQTLVASINERVVLDALYKWVLTERSTLFRRVTDDNLKARVISFWRSKTNELDQALSTPYHLVRSLTTCQSARSILEQWHLSSLHFNSLEHDAEGFRKRACISKGMRVWTARYQTCSEQDEWATNARFYVTTKRFTQKWQERTATLRKTKRREAYAVFRRNVKMNLARRVMHRWHTATSRVKELRRQAEELDYKRCHRTHASCYDTWRERLLALDEHHSQALTFNEDRLVRQSWDLCTHAIETVSRQQQLASAYLRLATEAASTKALRQMTWRIFQLKGQHELAESLRNRTSKKHYRNMLRYWANRMLRRHASEATLETEEPSVGGRFIEEWPGVEDSILTAKSQHPVTIPSTPGYLRTPSRRSAGRHYTHLKLPNTPATTQLTPHRATTRTPLSRSEFPQSTRSTFTRRLAENQSQRFDDILETSPVRSNEG